MMAVPSAARRLGITSGSLCSEGAQRSQLPGRVDGRELEVSKGPGRIERAILSMVEARAGGVLLHSWEVTCAVFGTSDADKPSPAQRNAVSRAMRSFVRRFPQYALTGWRGRKRSFLYEPGDPLSAMWAKLQMETRREVSREEAGRALDSIRQAARRRMAQRIPDQAK